MLQLIMSLNLIIYCNHQHKYKYSLSSVTISQKTLQY